MYDDNHFLTFTKLNGFSFTFQKSPLDNSQHIQHLLTIASKELQPLSAANLSICAPNPYV